MAKCVAKSGHVLEALSSAHNTPASHMKPAAPLACQQMGLAVSMGELLCGSKKQVAVKQPREVAMPDAGSSIQWGAWGSVGMAAASPAALARIARSGMGVIPPAAGLAALHAALAGFATLDSAAHPLAELVASPFDWAALLRERMDSVPNMFKDVAHAINGSASLEEKESPVWPPAALRDVASAVAPPMLLTAPAAAPSRQAVLHETTATVHTLLGQQVGTLPSRQPS